MKYVIHTSPKRIDFVNKYQVPILIKYGINEKDIVVWNDTEFKGQLKAWLECAEEILKTDSIYDGCWHLEDDVVPCKDFLNLTSQPPQNDIVQGFRCKEFDDHYDCIGKQPIDKILYGSQCIWIPNVYLKSMLKMFEEEVLTGKRRKPLYDAGKFYSDTLLKCAMNKYHKYTFVYNLENSLVDHIDYLIGGSSVGVIRSKKICRAIKFDNQEEIDKLEQKLKEDNFG